jgi:hypothetical protein
VQAVQHFFVKESDSGRTDWANFRPMGEFLLWVVFLIAKVAENGLLSSSVEIMHYIILTKMGWATHWASFSQILLVTLSAIFNE